CAHEWAPAEAAPAVDSPEEDATIRDAVGNPLADGDTVTLVKSVKISGGGGGALKVGTKVRNIRLTEDTGVGNDVHARLHELGRLKMKSTIVKKRSAVRAVQ